MKAAPTGIASRTRPGDAPPLAAREGQLWEPRLESSSELASDTSWAPARAASATSRFARTPKLRRVPIVARPLDAAGQKMSDLVRAGGEQVTDKVADAVKERLFGAPASQPTTVDAQATSSTTQR